MHRSHQHSLFLAHVSPGVTAAWPGPEHDAHFQAEPWFHVHTEHNTLFRVINHVRDLGHFLVLGATGAGKSTFGNFLRAQWMQYPNAQAKVFDLDGHARLLTYLLGGTWHDLGSPTLRFQPLRHVDDPLRRGIALQWLLDLCGEFGIPLTAGTHAFLSAGLTKLAVLPPGERTLSHLLVCMADHTRQVERSASSGRIDAQGMSHPDLDLKALAVLQLSIRQMLHQFALGGEYDGIFDGNVDVLGQHPVQTFELRSLLQRPRLVGPVLGYVFPEIERQMRTDAPMFLLLDDAAVTWLTPERGTRGQLDIRQKLEQRCRDWLMTTRKKNVSLGFSTHSLSQVFSSALGPLLEEGCPSRFFLPTTAAMEPAIAEIYMRLGLTTNALRTIATSRPQRDVYYMCKELGQRTFSLPLGPLGLECLASNTVEDHVLMEALLAQEGIEGFAARWLDVHGFHEEAQYVEAWHAQAAGAETPSGLLGGDGRV